ncbi:MAG: RNA methyltransferase [Bacteroidetes bacterium]|nr:RNA methyltransferase [Bacteroidota bacterium]
MKKTQPNEVSPALLAYLQGFISDDRKVRFEEVLAERTRHITCVLENIVDAHNANAVIRTCECFGIQDVHVIENEHRFKAAKKVLQGAHKWLSIFKYKETESKSMDCIRALKAKGYKIVATSPHAGSIDIHELELNQPLALVMGQENIGISEVVKAEADVFVKIPMQGFTESLNISVAAAILLQEISSRLRRIETDNWKLSEIEKDEIRKEWTLKNIYRNELLIERFYQDQKNV